MKSLKTALLVALVLSLLLWLALAIACGDDDDDDSDDEDANDDADDDVDDDANDDTFDYDDDADDDLWDDDVDDDADDDTTEPTTTTTTTLTTTTTTLPIEVTGVSPLTADLDALTTFTVTGSNMPDTLVAWIDHCAGLTFINREADQQQFQCTPDETGLWDGVVKDQPGGTELHIFQVNVIDDDDDCEGCLIEASCYADGEANPDNPCQICQVASDTGGWTDNDGASCDDGLDCTQNICHESLCLTTPLFDCSWPAESSMAATNLTGIEGPLINDFHRDLSGAVWNPLEQTLWVCRNNGPSKIWAVVKDGSGGFEIDYQGADRGEWTDFGDLEGLTLADLSEPKTLYLIVEGQEHIKEYDLSTYGAATLVNDWNTSAHLPVNGGSGAEGITFVPDSFLAQQGFTDPNGDPYLSTQGMGGLMFVAHQNGGNIYVFDLNRSDGSFVFVGEYKSDRNESAGLEFDRSTGLMYIWHGASHNVLEVAGISSTDAGGMRKLDTIKVITGPAPVLFGSSNYEGIALTSNDDCAGGHRGFFLTIDGGGFHSLLLFDDFPCE
jgi:hypothetical protein